uniref:Reverse transcriptase domain-containing protein n=1 Tax=Panagrellus redivivus TaxID=6233 RepID=A0A7E4VBC1_PANRE
MKTRRYSTDVHSETPALQSFLDKLFQWCDDNKLAGAPQKGSVLHVGPNNPRRTYKFGSTTIPSLTELRDLGIQVSDDLTLQDHQIHRPSTSDPPLQSLRAANLGIRYRHLQSCESVLANTLESVQHFATHIIYNRDRKLRSVVRPCYEERLRHLRLKTLSARRTITDLKTIHSIIYGYSHIKIGDLKFKEFKTRGPKKKLLFKKAKTSIRRQSFLHRSASKFNSLPTNIQCISHRQKFLNEINDRFD